MVFCKSLTKLRCLIDGESAPRTICVIKRALCGGVEQSKDLQPRCRLYFIYFFLLFDSRREVISNRSQDRRAIYGEKNSFAIDIGSEQWRLSDFELPSRAANFRCSPLSDFTHDDMRLPAEPAAASCSLCSVTFSPFNSPPSP